MTETKKKTLLPDAFFGEIKRAIMDWRAEIEDNEDDEDDDEELDITPEDILMMLGFDPKELNTKGTQGD